MVVAPLTEGTRERARELVADGPPFKPKDTDLSSHRVYVTEREVVFVFESAQPHVAVEQLTGDARMWRAAAAWRDILAGRPRLAEQVYDWSRSDGT